MADHQMGRVPAHPRNDFATRTTQTNWVLFNTHQQNTTEVRYGLTVFTRLNQREAKRIVR